MGSYVLAVVDDIFFATKIRGTAEAIGVEVRFSRSADEASERARADLPTLVIADLHSAKCDPFRLAAELKADERLRGVPLIGFFSHVQTELKERAERSGFDRVMPRSAFSKNLAELLKG